MFTGSSSENVFSDGVEENLTDSTRRNVYPSNGIEVLRLPTVLAPSLECGRVYLPDEGFSILCSRCDDRIVERRPIGVEYGPCVATCEGN